MTDTKETLMFKVDQKRALIVAEQFYPWKALMAISLLFTVLSFIPIVPTLLQAVFQLLGVGAIFLAGGRWIFDRVIISPTMQPMSEKEYDNPID